MIFFKILIFYFKEDFLINLKKKNSGRLAPPNALPPQQLPMLDMCKDEVVQITVQGRVKWIF